MPRKAARKPQTKPRRKGKSKAAAPAVAPSVLAWEDDPMSTGAKPVERPAPDVTTGRLKARISGVAVPAARYDKGTPEFRRWAATDALERALEFWGACVPDLPPFRPTGSDILPVQLDAGPDLNAYYYNDRGLEFHHVEVGGKTLYSSESPDVVLHETGHAVLDALRPDLFDTMSIEAAAFHEAFGDISAILVGLQLPSLRDAVLAETGGNLYRTSRLSRLAESLAWGLRQSRPDRVPPDCLRNAVNSWVYRDPRWLPSDGPDSQLTAAPHNLCRVFTGGFFEALSGMFAIEGSGSDALQKTSCLAAEMITAAVREAPIVSAYFSSVATAFINAAEPRHRETVTSAMVRRGLVPVSMLAGPKSPGFAARMSAAGAAEYAGVERKDIPGERFGLVGASVRVKAPAAVGPRHPGASLTGAALSALPQAAAPDADDATLFTEQLFRRGRIHAETVAPRGFCHNRFSHKTHTLVNARGAIECRRVAFDCGLGD